MDPNGWAAVAAGASALAAFASLYVAFFQSRTADQTADFANCLKVVEALNEAQRRCAEAPNEHLRRREFNDLVNLMEVLAKLHNDKKLTPSTCRIVEDYLDEAWAWLHADPSVHPFINDAVTSPDTYNELTKFAGRAGSRWEEHFERFRRQIAHESQAPITEGAPAPS